jgi:hypothetical protein
MSETTSPPSLPPLPPQQQRLQRAEPIGCLPCLIFLLTLAAIGGAVALKCGCLPKEKAGRTMLEVLGSPTKEQMQAHVTRITTREVLARAARNKGADEQWAERTREHLEVEARGPFLTLTVFNGAAPPPDEDTPATVANLIAHAYQDDLKEEIEQQRRLPAQARAAYLTLQESEVEKARLVWLDVMQKHGMTPDGESLPIKAALGEFASRLAKVRADMMRVEAHAAVMNDDDPAKAAAAAELKALAAEADKLKAASDDAEKQARQHQAMRSEADHAKATYERLRAQLQAMRAEDLKEKIEHSAVLRPVRVVEAAHAVNVPERGIRSFVILGIAASVALGLALLLGAVASRLCRRCP